MKNEIRLKEAFYMVKKLEDEHNRMQEIRDRIREDVGERRRKIREDFHSRVMSHVNEIYNESKETAREYSLYDELRDLERFYQTIKDEVFSEGLGKSFSVYGEAYSSFRLTQERIRKKAKRFGGAKR